MKNQKIIHECDLCNQPYQTGAHRYEHHNLKLYGITICHVCWNANHDGFGPQYHDKLLAYLKSNNRPEPELNHNGFLPRD